MNPSDVWIVTLGYNHIDDTLECLQSLAASEGGPYTLLFVDNASSDSSPAKVREAFPQAHILENGGAIGYCAEAIAIHEHSNAPSELFRRGWQIGSFHRLNPDLLRRFRNSSVRIVRKNTLIPPAAPQVTTI